MYLLTYFLSDFAADVASTVIGGAIFTLLAFVVNEYVVPKPDVSGSWKLVSTTTHSSFGPFLNLKMSFDLHLLQQGLEVVGSGEKVSEINSSEVETTFEREKRVV